MVSLLRDDSASRTWSDWPPGLVEGNSPSITASSYDPAIERTRLQLISAIRDWTRNPITWSDRDDPVPVENLSAETGIASIRRLPSDRAFPKIAPDGDGGLMLVWKGRERKTLVSVDRVMLLLVSEPGRGNSHHFRPLRFDGEAIPAIVLEHLPPR
jgi:hypothetical protein